jgi:sporulation protein YlmC with PRC-barrel domain
MCFQEVGRGEKPIRERSIVMRNQFLYASILSAAVALPTAAQAQQQTQQQPQPQVAQQCLQDLQQFRIRAEQDGYWLAGWGARWGFGTAAAPPAGAAVPPAAAPPAGTPGAVRTDTPTTGAFDTVGPWGAAGVPAIGIMSPRHQMRTIYSAAIVFGHRGNDAACQALLSELEGIYDETIAALQEAGIRPDEVVTWRQEQIIAARDVTEVPWTISSDQITGTEIRNARDEYLGDVDDIVFDRETGEVTYVIVSHGGFLGIGADHVAIPWDILQVAPGMNLFVLNVPETVIENAPRVDPDRFASPAVYDEYRQIVDPYWEQHAPT